MNQEDKLKHLTVLYHLNGADEERVLSWAELELATNATPHALADELFLPNADIRSILATIARERFEFLPFTSEGVQFVQRVVSQYLARFLNRDITPMQLCRMVVQVDSEYLDADFPLDHPLPSWVSELWNACDWCDDTWTHESAHFLVVEARRLLKEMTST